jgi:hypothetical protein
MPIILKFGLWAVGAIVLVLVYWNVQYQWQLRKHHGMSRSSFLDYFAERGFKNEIAAAVYDYYRSRSLSQTFGISPEDDISELFNQAEDDIEDDFTGVLKKLDLAMPSDQAWESRGEPPVRTVEDLVRVLAWAAQNQPREQQTGVAGAS